MLDAHSTPQSLFLADFDDDPLVQNAPQIADIDIDAIFADVEDDENDLFSFKPLAPALDTEALRREAELRHKNNIPALTPHAILPSSSPPRETASDQAPKSKQGTEGKKERRKPVRLDEGRLLGPTGFPQLIKNTKNFRTKGKGHEATDLNRLLQIYQFWTHEMFPPGQFRDTVDRVEKLCHSKRMNVALSVWRDEAHGVVHDKNVEGDEGIENIREDVKDETPASRPSSGSARADYASSSSPAPSRPPSSGTEIDFDDFDIDAVIREEVERNARERARQEQDHVGKGKGKMIVTDENDDAMWNEMDPIPDVPTSGESSITVTGGSGDDDMWDAVDAIEERSSTLKSLVADKDEDMWDVVKEMENAPAAIELAATSLTESTTAAAQPSSSLNNDDDDWEDMYV